MLHLEMQMKDGFQDSLANKKLLHRILPVGSSQALVVDNRTPVFVVAFGGLL